MKKKIFVDPKTKESLCFDNCSEYLVSPSGSKYQVKDNVPYLIYPRVLDNNEKDSWEFYQGRADQYEDTLHLTFKTHGLDEESTRQTFIDKLNLRNDSKVLEIACGTGRDSVLIANRLSKGGELHLQDLSSDMLRICHDKLKDHDSVSSFALANAQYLPYPDHYFDGVYSFGALGEFSDIALAIKEMVRVSKIGAKIVIGDESVPSWLRKTNYFKILKETNPMFEAKLPLDALPIEARNTSIHYVIGQTFYLIEFEVGKGEPTADFDFDIPGIRGGSYRTRYEGKLEGVSKEAYELAWEEVKNNDSNMHDWLSKLIIKELRNK